MKKQRRLIIKNFQLKNKVLYEEDYYLCHEMRKVPKNDRSFLDNIDFNFDRNDLTKIKFR